MSAVTTTRSLVKAQMTEQNLTARDVMDQMGRTGDLKSLSKITINDFLSGKNWTKGTMQAMRDWANASRSGELQLSMQCEETTSRRKAKRTPSPLPAKVIYCLFICERLNSHP